MSFEIERYDHQKHYPMVLSWWNEWANRPLPPGLLSETGYIITKGGRPVLACWVYYGNSKLMFMGFPVSDPKSGVKERAQALILMTRKVKEFADRMGFLYVFGMSSNRAYSRILRKEKFNDYKQHDVFLYHNASATIQGKGSGRHGSLGGSVGSSPGISDNTLA